MFADRSLETYLPLVGDKFLVTDGKQYEVQYVFDDADALLQRIETGESGDILITNSADIIDQLNTGGQIYKNETIPLICSRMAIIVSDKNEEDISVDRFFIHYDTDAEEMEPEGYRRYTDLLWELYGEEGWQEE